MGAKIESYHVQSFKLFILDGANWCFFNLCIKAYPTYNKYHEKSFCQEDKQKLSCENNIIIWS